MISSDKAVNPSNVMESRSVWRSCSYWAQRDATQFGGALWERAGQHRERHTHFRAIVANRKAITITIPKQTLFQAIPGRAAGSSGFDYRKGRDLRSDMGEPVKVVDLAHT
jgi:FlaA1/EpsC-like NDP-sugar epimerase